jgi:hypothetical protein
MNGLADGADGALACVAIVGNPVGHSAAATLAMADGWGGHVVNRWKGDQPAL